MNSLLPPGIFSPLLLLAASISAPASGGFAAKGRSLASFEVRFRDAGLDRSSPEATVRSFVAVVDDSERIAAWFAEAHDRTLGEIARRLGTTRFAARAVPARPRSPAPAAPAQVEFTKRTALSAAIVALEVALRGRGPRQPDRHQRFVLAREGNVWKLREHFRRCWSCKGTGKCAPCGGRAARGRSCRSCRGSLACQGCAAGWRPARQFRTPPRRTTRLPSLRVRVALDTPRRAFDTFRQLADLGRAAGRLLDNRMQAAARQFVGFFFVAGYTKEAPAVPYERTGWKVLEVDAQGARGRVRFTRHVGEVGAMLPVEVLVLVKDAGGAWRVDALVGTCARCQGSGRSPDGRCTRCDGKGQTARPLF